MDAVIRVMLVDDHAIVREGYRRLLDKEGDIAVIAEAGDGVGAYRLYKDAAPDVVIMDISMPGRGGIDVIRQMRQWDSHARVLVFRMHVNASYALQAFRGSRALRAFRGGAFAHELGRPRPEGHDDLLQ